MGLAELTLLSLDRPTDPREGARSPLKGNGSRWSPTPRYRSVMNEVVAELKCLGVTGIRMTRVKRRFVNVFPGKSVQFAHGGSPLQGLGLSSEPSIDRGYQSMPVSDLAERLDEARLLAAFAYWKAGEGQLEGGSHARGR